MRTKFVVFGGLFAILFLFGFLLFWSLDDRSNQQVVAVQEKSSSPQKTERPKPGPFDDKYDKKITAVKKTPDANKQLPEAKTDELTEDTYETAAEPVETFYQPDPADFLTNIEDIKAEIYRRNIEYADQVDLIDDLIQTGAEDTRPLWNDDWTSVDDWKKKSNGFKLEKNDNGELIFTPDEQTSRNFSFFETPQAYRYNEAKREFVYEVDFYGKKITNIARFINDNVLVMIMVNGDKADVNIYQKNTVEE
jgi:hypothetical protein